MSAESSTVAAKFTKLMMKQEKMVDFKVPKFQKFQSSKFQSPNDSPINSGKLIEGRKHTS